MPRGMQKTAAAKAASGKLTATKDIEQAYEDIIDLFNKLNPKNQTEILKKLGVGGTNGEFYTCQRCGKLKRRKEFYVSTEPCVTTGLTHICKVCAGDIAMPIVDGRKEQPSKDSVDKACYALNKPFLESVWEASLLEAANTSNAKTKDNVWTAYIKNIQMTNYISLTYQESDNYTGGKFSMDYLEKDALPADQEILEQFEKNKKDVLRLIGYLPFENEMLSDQPFLYAQLIGMLDSSEEGNDDMMRTASIIVIVRGYLQIQKLDDQIAALTKDIANLEKNMGVIRGISTTKKSINDTIMTMARESCISLKNTKNAKKGENTWTGKLKKLKDFSIREIELNGYDVGTCKGMQQVADISMNAILKSLNLDESEWSDMIAEQRIKIDKLMRETNAYQEAVRLLLKENLDLRDTLELNSLLDKENLLDLDEVVNTYISGEMI